MKARETAKQTLTIAFTVVSFLAALGGAIKLVDGRIESQLRDPRTIQTLADQVRRPSLIFDSKNRILDDQGAMDYLSSPPRFEDASETGRPVVVVAPTVHLASPPLLQVLDAYAYDFIAERGEGHQWIFRGQAHTGGFAEGAQSLNPRFRLEIIW